MTLGRVFAATAAVASGPKAMTASHRQWLLAAPSVGRVGLWPVAHHGHGYAHQQHKDPAKGNKPGDGAQLQLALHHDHVVFPPLLGFPLALRDLAGGAEGILLSGGYPQ